MSAGRPHLLRRILRRVQCPWVSVLLLVLLVADAAMLPKAPGGNTSTVGRWIGGTRRLQQEHFVLYAAIDRSNYPKPNPPQWFPVQPPASKQFHVMLGRNHIALTGPTWTHSGTVSLSEEREGFWAPVVFTSNFDVDTWSLTGHPVTQDLCNAIADNLQNTFPDLSAIFDAPLRAGPGTHSSVLWTGHAHNAAAILAALLFLLSLGWIPRLGIFHRARRRALLGLCVNCGYDRRGDYTTPCPECGWVPRTEAVALNATTDALSDRPPSPP